MNARIVCASFRINTIFISHTYKKYFRLPTLAILKTKTCSMPKVIILGGGVAGMSAAHELIERGFEVQVFERKIRLPGVSFLRERMRETTSPFDTSRRAISGSFDRAPRASGSR